MNYSLLAELNYKLSGFDKEVILEVYNFLISFVTKPRQFNIYLNKDSEGHSVNIDAADNKGNSALIKVCDNTITEVDLIRCNDEYDAFLEIYDNMATLRLFLDSGVYIIEMALNPETKIRTKVLSFYDQDALFVEHELSGIIRNNGITKSLFESDGILPDYTCKYEDLEYCDLKIEDFYAEVRQDFNDLLSEENRVKIDIPQLRLED